MITSRILGVLASGSITAQNQISDEALVALAKKKEGKVKAADFVTFWLNFINSTKDIYIQYLIQEMEKNKNQMRDWNIELFDRVKRSKTMSPQAAQQILGDPNITKEAWIAKFDKEWNPKKFAEERWQGIISNVEDKESIIKQVSAKKFSEVVNDVLNAFEPNDPRKTLAQQQLKQWLDKY
jgi:hypothetical protein